MQIRYRAPHTSPAGTPVMPNLTSVIGGKNRFSGTDSESSMVAVSAVIITYNEEAIIGKTLSRLWWCQEIIIVDSGSTDKTLEICKSYHCKVFNRAFNGFGEQKKFGVSQAANDWILCIDADEVLTENLIDEIMDELNKPAISFAAFSIPRNLVFMNRIFHYGKEANSPIIRLFNKTRGNWDGAMVHEKVVVNGPTRNLGEKILHYSYTDYHQFLQKVNLYSTLAARKLLEKKRRKSRLVTILALPFNFFRYYIIHRNFMNGYRGFAWSVLNTTYHFVKYLKLEELRKKADS